MDLSANIYNTLLKLCSLKGTSGTKEEAAAAEGIYSIISDMEYFREHKGSVKLHPVEGDDYGRSFVTAFYSGSSSKNVVVLLSHFDVVDAEEFGDLKKYAYSPVELSKALTNCDLPDDIIEDLKSGDWLFGRGTMDMKCGLAIHIELLRYIYENNIKINGNILLLTVPDEENSSAGMVSASQYLSELKDKGYEILSVINSEPFFEEYPGDNNKYIYTGTIGKLLPFVFSAGVLAHASDPFIGISSSLLSSTVTYLMEDNTSLCESKEGFITPPPVCLKQEDLKGLYSVSTPDFSYSYYNYMTLTSLPHEVIENMKGICKKAFEMSITRVEKEHDAFSAMNKTEYKPIKFEPHVLSYSELCSMLKDKGMDIEKIKDRYKNSGLDMREATGLIVSDMLRLIPELRPAMVVGFAPPYYPHRIALKDSPVMDVCRKVMKKSEDVFGDKLIHKDFYPGLCDLSYLGFEDPEEYYALEDNMPLFKDGYNFPVKALSNINIDGMNIGVLGKGCHRYTERLYMPYSFHVTPDLVLYALMEFLS